MTIVPCLSLECYEEFERNKGTKGHKQKNEV